MREGAPAAASAPPAAQVTAPPADVTPVTPPDVDPAPQVETPAPSTEPDATPAEPAATTPAPAAPVVPPEPPGMAQVRKAEQHMRRQIAEERQRWQAEQEQARAQNQSRLDKAAEVEARIANARQDPLAALAALGFTSPEDLDAVGKLAYWHGTAGQQDPAKRAAAAQSAAQTSAQRKHDTELAELRKQVQELTQFQQQAMARQEAQAHVDRFMGEVSRALGDDAPLARAALAKNPERVKATMLQLAHQLWEQSGPSADLRDDPTAAEVIAAYEKMRAAELEELGIDPKLIGRAATAAPAAPAVPPARPAATIAPATAAAPTVPRTNAPLTQDELRAKALEGLAKMKQSA